MNRPKHEVQSATALPASPHDNQRKRIRDYSIAMGIRVVCIPFVFLLPGWLWVIPAIGVMVLPYIAVVLANVGSPYAAAPVNVPSNALVRREETP